MQFVFSEIVLGYFYIVFGDIVPLEIGHAHKGFITVHTVIDNLGSGMLVYGINATCFALSAKKVRVRSVRGS